MAVVPIKPAGEVKAPEPDPELIQHLETLLEYAKRGEVEGYCCGMVIGGEWDTWHVVDEEWTPVLFYAARHVARQLEHDD